MQKITPHLWYDTQAKEAAQLYVETFGEGSKITNITTIKDTPSGDADLVSFTLLGQEFQAISAGPYFEFNPSISFMVGCETKEEVDRLWKVLSKDGEVLMPLGTYDFSERYGWCKDRYGLSWQIIHTKPEGDERPRILPSLLFTNESFGKAEQARAYYLSVFKKSKEGQLLKYQAGQEPNKEGTVMFSDFQLFETWMVAMDGPGEHKFSFNEAVSFIVHCDTQEEIDYYWEKLSAVPESEQCGWCKDTFGVSWQIVPTIMEKLMASDDSEKLARVTQAFLKMKKFDIAELEKAAKG